MVDPNRKFQKELNAGAIALVLLAIMKSAKSALYGYEIVKLLQSRCPGDLPMNQGAVYPVLRSMEKQGLLTSELQPSNSGPPRRYYSLTSDGIAALGTWKVAWKETTDFVQSILENPYGDRSGKTASQRNSTNPSS